MLKNFGIILLCWLGFSFTAKAQVDTLSESNFYEHLPKRAAIFSAVLPGAGQIYNEIGYRKIPQKKHRAWWKVPIIYGGLGACGYFFYQNNKWASLLKQEYLFRQNNPGITYLDARFQNYSESQLTTEFDTYSQRRDYFIVGFIGVWALNVVEAYVDGHFVTFDVDENLSLSWQPTLVGYNAPGIGLRLNFN